MKLTLAEPKYLKESISVISELVNEARFKVTSNAVELVAMDPANVAMVIFKLLSSAFSEYSVEGDTEIGINLSNLKMILKRAKPNDTISLEVEESKLKIQLKSTSTRTFYIPIIELEDKDQRIPDLQFPVTVSTTSSTLSEAVDDVDVVGESVAFKAMKGKLTIAAEGDLSKAKVEIEDNEDTKVNSDSSEELKAKYSIEYLKKMVTGSKLSSNVSIQFNKDYPLKLEYKAMDKVLLSFILAPRVEND
ncbi:proliferating cell nuclear antigen (pcna) [Candidatus Woesearchaeota archaeon]|jgi:proliferating cell nuclear antigen|nr:proliferating cell nuclear antigen (pcna) [Candidatus Woesearchaeota archaeon]MBT3537513.1 proliferating cell nuclear antigen (pcna) [Candidatus Woesearchaeota archaeon]MBT4696817.1 proliferating cell nuclear antigen (pcna) [Candidatus Woesearchaeota archaeon]MBT4717638.1 proliferating cell nuclear antigen (pcna) [Candidatus Woesearchaeota archaeon]MBT7106177.1 proliferating cell nuclear antigen (pcna) [Candidatus Woesearchaeota archaeon]